MRAPHLADLPRRRVNTGFLQSIPDPFSSLKMEVYFAHPYSSWERGTNENTNGLLGQYLPKRMSFSELTDWQLESYVRALNNRPRKCLNYRTPAEVFHERPVALQM